MMAPRRAGDGFGGNTVKTVWTRDERTIKKCAGKGRTPLLDRLMSSNSRWAMNRRNLVLIVCLVASPIIPTPCGRAQGPPPPAVRYTLLKGSQLGLSMPCCPPPPQSFVMSGTFTLQLLDSSDPLVTRYQLTNVSFTAMGYGGNNRQLTGEGTYQVGGKEAFLQDMSLALQIDSGSTGKLCFFTNYDYSRAVQDAWTQIGISVFQTNGTDWEEYSMAIVAAPAPRFLSLMPDTQSGSVHLQWQAYDAVQLERATAVSGPYFPVATNLTSQSFVDVGALTNQHQIYYRLRQQ